MAVRETSDGIIFAEGLRIDPVLLTHGYPEGIGPHLCKGACCKDGVYVDVKERDAILAAQSLIIKYMDETQSEDPATWFEQEEDDEDFPSGRCAGTRTYGGKCVFLTKTGKCVLQITATNEGMPPFSLKPSYCVLFPLTIVGRTLTFDDFCSGPNPCCTISPVSAGSHRAVIEVCKTECIHAIGEENYAELLSIYYRRKDKGERWGSSVVNSMSPEGR